MKIRAKRKTGRHAIDEYHHVYNRGVGGKELFLETEDYIRFLFLLIYFQSPLPFNNTHRYVDAYKATRSFYVDEDSVNKILKTRYVELVNFCIMPNHFHLTISNREERGLAKYMQRVLTGYASYFNFKYESTGHVFESTYRSQHISSNDQLLYLSTYIHKNPHMHRSYDAIEGYPWSSLYDYIIKNRWGDLLLPGVVLNQFDEPGEYYSFLKSSTAKEIQEHLTI